MKIRGYQIDPAELAGRLHLLDASDIDPALHREQRVNVGSRQRIVTETVLLDALAKLVAKLNIGLVVIDNASDAYDDDEIKRARVRAFIRSLRLLQPFQFGVNGSSACEIGVEGGLLGVHRWLRDVIDDATMNALFNQEAKLFSNSFRIKG